MAQATRVLNFVMKGNTADFTKKWTTASALMNRTATVAGNVANKMAAMGTAMTTRFTLPIVGGLAAGTKAFSDFDKAMTESLAIMGNVSDQTRGQMESLAKQMSGQSTFAAKELGEAYFFLASAGLSAEQSIAALPSVTSFAQAGAFDMTTATDLLTDAFSALGPEIARTGDLAKDYVGLSDILVKANTIANATVQQFSEALTNEAGPAMRSFNIATEEGVAVLAAYADQGIKGNAAGSMFGRALRLLGKAALENKSQFAEMGISVFDANGKFRDFADISRDLEGALGGLSAGQRMAALSSLGFQARTQQAILPLVGASNAIENYKTKLMEAGGATQEVADKQMKAFANRMTVVKNKVVNAFMDIGKAVLPTVEAIANKIAEWATKFSNLSDGTKSTAVKIALFVAAIGPVLLIGAAMIKTVLGITSAVGMLKTALQFLAANPMVALVGAVVFAIGKFIQLGKILWDIHKAKQALTNSTQALAEMEAKYGKTADVKKANRDRWARDAKALKDLNAVMSSTATTEEKLASVQKLNLDTANQLSTTVSDKLTKAYEKLNEEAKKNANKKPFKYYMTEEDKEARTSFRDNAKSAMFDMLKTESKINRLLKDRGSLRNELSTLEAKGLGQSKRAWEIQQELLEGQMSLRDLAQTRKGEIKAKLDKQFDPKNQFVGAASRGSVEDYRARIQQPKKDERLKVQMAMERDLKRQLKEIQEGNGFLQEIATSVGLQDQLQPVTI